MTDPTLSTADIPEEVHAWLTQAVDRRASDLHLIPGYPPTLRLNGDLVELPDPPLSADDARALLTALCPAAGRGKFLQQKSLDFSFALKRGARATRFRVNLFHVGGDIAACLRLIPDAIPDFAWAGFPPELARKLARFNDGLVIVTGSTGSGKSTTLAMTVNLLNQAGGHRIITVEEPVEYLFPRMPNTVVTQREVGRDVPTFADGLKYGLRQDPDVILVGEIRDLETAQMCLSAAETGHLVFTTLHTRDAKGAVTRFPDFFPQESQAVVRAQLAMSLRAVVSQRLLPGTEKGGKRHLALEVLWNTHPIANAIRTGKVESIDNYLLTGREEGMVTFDESVRRLLKAGLIAREVAEQNVNDAGVLYR